MTSPKLTRATFLAAMLGAGFVAAAPAALAARDASVEQYVQSNASSALQTLGDHSLSDTARQQTFNTLVNQFSDIESTAQYVLGTYAPQVWRDPALKAQWVNAFRDFLIATYEDQLNQFSGGQVTVTGSTVVNARVIVSSRLTPRGARPLQVQWKLQRAAGNWRVFDIALQSGESVVWLAQQQQLVLRDQLSRNHGDIADLIRQLNQQTTQLRAHARANRH
ncbi:MAG: ABC transporter substrate-binding protein [Terricaulis sp.]